jgi:hypothetical protein
VKIKPELQITAPQLPIGPALQGAIETGASLAIQGLGINQPGQFVIICLPLGERYVKSHELKKTFVFAR